MSPKAKVRSLSEMKPDALAELGTTPALATRAVETVLKVERVYCAKFGEKNNLVHFHIFPRTKWIVEEYIKENPMAVDVISGPQLLDWTREKHSRI